MSENYNKKVAEKNLKMAEKICQSGGEKFLKHGHYVSQWETVDCDGNFEKTTEKMPATEELEK